jgi:transposase-like protein
MRKDYDKIKAKFLEDYAKDKSSVMALAKKYGISKPSAYVWVRKHNGTSTAPITNQEMVKAVKESVEFLTKEPTYVESVIKEAILLKKEKLNEELKALNEKKNTILKSIESLNTFIIK